MGASSPVMQKKGGHQDHQTLFLLQGLQFQIQSRKKTVLLPQKLNNRFFEQIDKGLRGPQSTVRRAVELQSLWAHP